MKGVSIFHYLTDILKTLCKNGVKAILDPIGASSERARAVEYKNIQIFMKSLNYSYADLAKNRELMVRFGKMKDIQVETVNWFIPDFDHAYGGIYTILRFADYFHTKKGVKNRLIIYGNQLASETAIKNRIGKIFPNLLSDEVITVTTNLDRVPQADVCIATFWTSAYLVLKFNKTQGKFYLIQDYEPLFYPAGILYALAEATYRFGFYGIANTQWLCNLYVRDYGGVAKYFMPSVDKEVFYPSGRVPSRPSVQNPFTIFFYVRPGNPRNAFELGVAALQEIKRNYGELVKIYAAGGDWDPRTYGLENTIVNLEVLPYEKTAMLYRKCDLGIFFGFSNGCAYIPLELMACGCPVLTNYNSASAWFLKDGFNCMLTEPSISCICEKVDILMNNIDLRKQIISNALNSLPKTSWDNEIEKIYSFICNPHAK